MKAMWFPIRERDLPFDDIDGKSVEFLLSGRGRNEGVMAGVGKFDLTPRSDGLVRLEIKRDFGCGCLDREGDGGNRFARTRFLVSVAHDLADAPLLTKFVNNF